MPPPERPSLFTKADKKSHFLSLMIGCCIGAFVSSIALLAFAMAYNG